MSNQASTVQASGWGSVGFFIPLYIVPAAITYFAVALVIFGTSARTVVLFVCYLVMVFACYLRGSASRRRWIAVIPAVGGLFDIFVGFIPFVPTIANIIAIAMGCLPAKKAS